MIKKENLPTFSEVLEGIEHFSKYQTENKQRRKEYKERDELKKKVLRHKDPVITLNDDPNELLYCACCWDSEEKVIQLTVDYRDKSYMCYHCGSHGFLQNNY